MAERIDLRVVRGNPDEDELAAVELALAAVLASPHTSPQARPAASRRPPPATSWRARR
jgi:hypothetical protein